LAGAVRLLMLLAGLLAMATTSENMVPRDGALVPPGPAGRVGPSRKSSFIRTRFCSSLCPCLYSSDTIVCSSAFELHICSSPALHSSDVKNLLVLALGSTSVPLYMFSFIQHVSLFVEPQTLGSWLYTNNVQLGCLRRREGVYRI
jgi:hypothetical protein